MDKKYKELFGLITQTVSNLAERVMEEHEKNNEVEAGKTAEIMRNDFLDLHDKLDTDEVLNKADYARLLVGTIIVVNSLESRIKNEQTALTGYKVDILPKLDQINNAEESNIEALAEELFKVKEEISESE